ncbi:hypothetical protein O3M35_009251 [Rhynocoris fuscipes]|uniref:Kazal-like domain-containing protein n=1 Tax=Rhynocoris fuscipes TaxID=488301 RepID=A0AAW1D268_9HEMI
MNAYLIFLTAFLIVSVTVDSKPHEADGSCRIVMCHMVYNPVCAQRKGSEEQRTFGNQCSLDRTNCFADPPFEFVKQGEC